MTASKFLIKLLILWHCNINAPAHLENVNELTFLYLQRADNFPTDKEPPTEVSKGVARHLQGGHSWEPVFILHCPEQPFLTLPFFALLYPSFWS